MRSIFFFILVFSLSFNFGNAQTLTNLNSENQHLPDSSAAALTKFFKGKYLLSFETVPFFISSQTEFDTLLDAETKKKIAPIDFSKYDLRRTKYCSMCNALCPPPEKPCHRNACQYSFSWMISTKPGERIASTPFTHLHCKDYTGPQTFLIVTNDSAYRELVKNCCGDCLSDIPDFTDNVLLVREENRDCNAQFFTEVFLDSASKTITWRLRSRYGGCRGMTTTVHQILVPKIAGYVYRQE